MAQQQHQWQKKTFSWDDVPPLEEIRKMEVAMKIRGGELHLGDVVRAPHGKHFVIASWYSEPWGEGQSYIAEAIFLNEEGNHLMGTVSFYTEHNLVYIQPDEVDHGLEDGYCPKCQVKLEWTHMAEKCPSCWKVYTGS